MSINFHFADAYDKTLAEVLEKLKNIFGEKPFLVELLNRNGLDYHKLKALDDRLSEIETVLMNKNSSSDPDRIVKCIVDIKEESSVDKSKINRFKDEIIEGYNMLRAEQFVRDRFKEPEDIEEQNKRD